MVVAVFFYSPVIGGASAVTANPRTQTFVFDPTGHGGQARSNEAIVITFGETRMTPIVAI